jgi:UDP-N-acetylmuramate: L-alanyl-gamma-D-glutamyl-meso-diaminopimelate ligase
MHIHILGICGTLMGSIALLAKAQGHTITGSDDGVYPPMSDQLHQEGIALQSPYRRDSIPGAADLVVLGNAGLGRGNPAVEALLSSGTEFCSGAEFLGRFILKDKWVIAVSGTHGKTTTASMITWILECAGLNPGYLIGGIPTNFERSARLTESPFFVIEADEYDTSFFDRQSKFLHYHPRTLVLNNLEFDHADIFADLTAIEDQFHQLIRRVPASGLIISNSQDNNIETLLKRGVWSEQLRFGVISDQDPQPPGGLSMHQPSQLISLAGARLGTLNWGLTGVHNLSNALAALAAARHVGVPPEQGIESLADFTGVKRRMEIVHVSPKAILYDDFAHHPTAIKSTLAGLRQKIGQAPLYAILEPRSHTMRLGIHQDQLAPACVHADRVFWLKPERLAFDLDKAVRPQGHSVFDDPLTLAHAVGQQLGLERSNAHIVIMSNGGIDVLKNALLDQISHA